MTQKFQKPKSKFQRILKLQISKLLDPAAIVLIIAIWDFLEAWDLEIRS
jgi:hypothetical protein